jgi:hypothetical protein
VLWSEVVGQFRVGGEGIGVQAARGEVESLVAPAEGSQLDPLGSIGRLGIALKHGQQIAVPFHQALTLANPFPGQLTPASRSPPQGIPAAERLKGVGESPLGLQDVTQSTMRLRVLGLET